MSTLRDKQRGEGELSVIIVIACIAAWITHVVLVDEGFPASGAVSPRKLLLLHANLLDRRLLVEC